MTKTVLEQLLSAAPGSIAPTVILPGDPLRAQFIAENFLKDPRLVNEARGMLCYTGLYEGAAVSVLGTGMGTSSMTASAVELIERYGAKNLIRVGTCGSWNPQVHVRDVILVEATTLEGNATYDDFGLYDFVPTADHSLLKCASDAATACGIPYRAGVVTTGDCLHPEAEMAQRNGYLWQNHGILGVEMEGAYLYATASRYEDVRALAIVTCSDHALYREEDASFEERQKSFCDMMRIALEVAKAQDKKGGCKA
ncbi:MAG: DeoD-type purine-nucleoside phosphorylase [Oscillospiraceae bacterium]|nr:DeoD-type purine-nucleoside phosphorylase [Oscillospiraceae bacterium]